MVARETAKGVFPLAGCYGLDAGLGVLVDEGDFHRAMILYRDPSAG